MAGQGSARVTLKEIDLSQVNNPQQQPQGVPAAVVESYAKPKPEDESSSMKQVLDQELARQDRERQEDAAQSRVQRIEAHHTNKGKREAFICRRSLGWQRSAAD